MLVLNRKSGQKVCIPQLDIVLTVLRISHGRVQIGLSAPREIKAYRAEVWERISGGSEGAAEQASGCVPKHGIPVSLG
jgi:carbon storage regulator CsrA